MMDFYLMSKIKTSWIPFNGASSWLAASILSLSIMACVPVEEPLPEDMSEEINEEQGMEATLASAPGAAEEAQEIVDEVVEMLEVEADEPAEVPEEGEAPEVPEESEVPEVPEQIIDALCNASCDIACVGAAEKAGFCAPGPETANAVLITPSRTECIAPCGIFFEAQLNDDFGVDRPFHELSYQWRFGDENAEFQALPDDFPEEFRDANSAQGPMAGHVFERAGTYEVTLTVSAPDRSFTDTEVTITVLDADEFYAGNQTICYSKNGDFDGCPNGALRYTDLANAASNIFSTSFTRLLLRAGEETVLEWAIESRGTQDVQIGRFGDSADPIIRILDTFPTAAGSAIQPRDTEGFTVWGVDVRGTYDPTTGLGETYGVPAILNLGAERNVTVYRNRFSGIGMGVTLINKPMFIIVADNTFTDWYEYGALDSSPSGNAYIGNSMKQNVDAVSGPGARDSSIVPRWANQGPIRAETVDSFVFSQNDLFSNTGWSSGGLAHQQTLRYNSNGTLGHRGVINRNRLEGGYAVVALNTQNSSTEANLGDVLFERNIMIGTDNTIFFVGLQYGNTSIRNNLAIMPDRENTWNEFDSFFQHVIYSSSSDNTSAPVRIENNTLVNLQSTSARDISVITFVEGDDLVDVTETNNLVHAPDVPNAADFPSMLPLDADDYYRPLQGSPAIGAGTVSDLVPDTIDGLLRDSAVSLGALEPIASPE